MYVDLPSTDSHWVGVGDADVSKGCYKQYLRGMGKNKISMQPWPLVGGSVVAAARVLISSIGSNPLRI